jgi:hypothetical protein
MQDGTEDRVAEVVSRVQALSPQDLQRFAEMVGQDRRVDQVLSAESQSCQRLFNLAVAEYRESSDTNERLCWRYVDAQGQAAELRQQLRRRSRQPGPANERRNQEIARLRDQEGLRWSQIAVRLVREHPEWFLPKYRKQLLNRIERQGLLDCVKKAYRDHKKRLSGTS